jgi:hypothetical protein
VSRFPSRQIYVDNAPVLFVVVVDDLTTKQKALAERVKTEREREHDWWSAALDQALAAAGDCGADRRAARAALRAERTRRRADGEFLATRDLLLTASMRVVLDRRGYAHEWDEPPAGAYALPGRPVGVSPHDAAYIDSARQDKRPLLRVEFPDDLGETIRRATYWVSKPHIDQLLQWADRYGPGPGAAEGEAAKGNPAAGLMMLAAALNPPSAAAMQARRELRAKIVTTGDLIRECVAEALATPLSGTRRIVQ